MLIVVLLLLSIGFIHNIMNLFLDVLDVLKKFGFPISLCLIIERLFLCSYNGKSYVNGGQWLKSQEYLKSVVANRVVEGSVIVYCSYVENK